MTNVEKVKKSQRHLPRPAVHSFIERLRLLDKCFIYVGCFLDTGGRGYGERAGSGMQVGLIFT